MMGAFGAHALQGSLDARSLEVFQTAVRYQMWHSLALLFVAFGENSIKLRIWRYASALFLMGMVLFCGSLYALVFGAPSRIGLLTPFGGLCLMCGWFTLALVAWRIRRDENRV